MGSVSSYFSLLTVLSVFAALFAIIYQGYLASLDLRSLTDILKNLNHLEFAVQVSKPRVAIGYGSCSDLYVKAVDFLNFTEALQRSLDQTTPFNVDDITTEDEFLQSFAYYFQRGAAAEYNFFNQSPRGFFIQISYFRRFTGNKELFQKLVRLAKKHPVAEPRWALGGNAPVIGSRLASEGAEVVLAAKMSSK